MKYSVERAFGFVKSDKEWVKKLVIGSLIIIASLLLFLVPVIMAVVSRMFNAAVGVEIGICWIIALFLGFSVSGFCVQAGHDRIFSENAPLPDWNNFGNLIFLGFKYSVGSMLFYLPVVILGLVAGIVEILSAGGLSQAAAANAHNAPSAASLIMNAIYNIVYVIFMALYFAFASCFLRDFNIFTFLNFPKVFRMLKGNGMDYFIVLLLILAVGIVFNIAAVLLAVTIIGILLLPFATIYIQIVSFDLMAQFAVIADKDKYTSVS